MTADPKHVEPDSDDPEDIDSEEIVNDSLGEETPADSTGLDADDAAPASGNRQQPSNPAGFPTRSQAPPQSAS